ncbi:MAG: hypothetical protein ACE5EN_04960 [Nitrospinota bacterium]
MSHRNKLIMIVNILIALAALTPSANAGAGEKGFDVGAVSVSSVADKIQWHGYYEFEYYDQEGSKSSYDAHKIVV